MGSRHLSTAVDDLGSLGQVPGASAFMVFAVTWRRHTRDLEAVCLEMKSESTGTGVMSGKERQTDKPRRTEAGRKGRESHWKQGARKTQGAQGRRSRWSGAFWKGRAVPGSDAAPLKEDSRAKERTSAQASARPGATLESVVPLLGEQGQAMVRDSPRVCGSQLPWS